MLTDQTFLIANSCNLKCTYCWYETGSAPYSQSTLTAGEYDVWLTRCSRRAAVENVNFTGGEPLLRDDFLDLVEVAARHASGTAVFTNGVLLTEHIASTLLATGCEIQVSLDHASDTVGDRVRGGTTKTLRALELLTELGAGQRTQVCVVVTSHNWRDLEAVVDIVVRGGFRLELIPVAVPDLHPLSLATLSEPERADLRALITRWQDLLGRPLYYRRLARWLATKKLPGVSSCSVATRGIFVNAAGAVQLCALRHAVSLGNIRTDGPEEILARKSEEVLRKKPGSCVSLDCLVVV